MKHKISITLATLAVCAFTLPAFASYSDFMDKTTVKVGLNFTEADGHGTDYLYSPAACLTEGAKNHYKIHSLHPDSHFDWSLGLAYRLKCSQNSFVVEYNHFRDTTRIDTHADGASFAYGLGDVADEIPSHAIVDGASIKSSVRYEEKDWKFGFRRTVKCAGAEVVLGALLEHAEVTRDFNNETPSAVVADVETDSNPHTLYAREKVKGFGPAFDMMATVKLCGTKQHAFNAFAYLGVALLRTDNDYRQTVWYTAQGAPTAETVYSAYSTCGERTHSVVSKLDMAIGLGWKCAMTCCPDISVKAGVKYLNYSNLFKSGSVHLGHGSTDVPTRAVGDYGRFGPFIEFSIGGAKA